MTLEQIRGALRELEVIILDRRRKYGRRSPDYRLWTHELDMTRGLIELTEVIAIEDEEEKKLSSEGGPTC